MKAKMRTKKGFVYPRLCWFAGRSLVGAILLIVVLMVCPVNGEVLEVDLAVGNLDITKRSLKKRDTVCEEYLTTFSFTVRNNGGLDADKPFEVKIWPGKVTNDAGFITVDPVSFRVHRLNARTSVSLDHTMWVPVTDCHPTYMSEVYGKANSIQVAIEVDPQGVYSESNRNNNILKKTLNPREIRTEFLPVDPGPCQECPQGLKAFQFKTSYGYLYMHKEFMDGGWPEPIPQVEPSSISIDKGFSVKPVLPDMCFPCRGCTGGGLYTAVPIPADFKLIVYGPGIPSDGQEMTFKWVFSPMYGRYQRERYFEGRTKGVRVLRTETDQFEFTLEIPYAYTIQPFVNDHERPQGELNTAKWTFCYRVVVTEKYFTPHMNIPGPQDAWGSYRIGLHDVVGQPYGPAEHAEIGEGLVPRDWERVSFGKAFSDPVVVANSLSYDGPAPAVVRIRNLDDTGFEIRVQEWDYEAGAHSPETVGYIVMEQGAHTLPDGTRVEAGRFDTNRTGFHQVFFSQDFEVPPVVITAVCSDNETDAVTTRMRNVSTTGFEVRMQEQELNEQEHALETISYIAWEPSSGTIDGVAFEVNRTANKVRHNWHTIALGETYGKAPVFIADMQTQNGGDPANVRWDNKDAYGVDVKITEEQSKDSETFHCREVVGYMAFSQALDQGPADLVEMEHGRPVTDLWAEQGDALYFTIDVPASVSELALESSGGTGDGDLHVRYGAIPTLDEWDYRPYSVGNDEIVKIPSPIPGTWHVMIHAYEGFDDVTLGAYFRGLSAPDLWAELGEALYFAIDVPDGTSELAFEMYGGTGDADIYVRYGEAPTVTDWDYRPYQWGNDETVHIPFPMSGTWHVMIHAYDTFDGVTLEGNYLD